MRIRYKHYVSLIFISISAGKLNASLPWLILDIDECLNSPCMQGQCNNLVGSFNCSCNPGWKGRFCNGIMIHLTLLLVNKPNL